MCVDYTHSKIFHDQQFLTCTLQTMTCKVSNNNHDNRHIFHFYLYTSSYCQSMLHLADRILSVLRLKCRFFVAWTNDSKFDQSLFTNQLILNEERPRRGPQHFVARQRLFLLPVYFWTCGTICVSLIECCHLIEIRIFK